MIWQSVRGECTFELIWTNFMSFKNFFQTWFLEKGKALVYFQGSYLQLNVSMTVYIERFNVFIWHSNLLEFTHSEQEQTFSLQAYCWSQFSNSMKCQPKIWFQKAFLQVEIIHISPSNNHRTHTSIPVTNFKYFFV